LADCKKWQMARRFWYAQLCAGGCYVCNYGEAWQLREALRLRGGRSLSCCGKKVTKEAALRACSRCPSVYRDVSLRELGKVPPNRSSRRLRSANADGWQPEFGEANPHRALRCCGGQYAACSDAQSAEVDEGTRRTQIAGRSSLTQKSVANQIRDVVDAVPYVDCLVTEHCLEP
jgi:hypothetical protein